MIPPVVWIPAGFALGLALALWGGMSWAYDRGGRHVREELEALAAARSFRRLPRVPPHVPPGRARHPVYRDAVRDWAEHEREALAVAEAGRQALADADVFIAQRMAADRHPSGPMRRLEAVPDELTDSQFTRRMAAEVAEGMAAVDAYLHGREP